MARVKRAVHSKKHRRAVLEQAQGYFGNKSRSYRAAHEQVMHSLQYAYRDRRARKGDFRQLWIQRINAGARSHGMSYSRLIAGLRIAGVEVDRKILADLAVRDDAAFAALVDVARDALASETPRRAGQLPARPRPELRAGPADALAYHNDDVQRLRRLAQAPRPSRQAEGRFVVEGAKLLAEALGRAGPRRRGVPRPGRAGGPSTTAAGAGPRPPPGARSSSSQAGVLARACDAVTPQPIAAIVSAIDVPLDVDPIADPPAPLPPAPLLRGRVRRSPRPGQRRDDPPQRRGAGARQRGPAAPARSTCTTRRRCGPRPASLFHVPVVAGADRRRGARPRWARWACRRWGTAAPGRTTTPGSI